MTRIIPSAEEPVPTVASVVVDAADPDASRLPDLFDTKELAPEGTGELAPEDAGGFPESHDYLDLSELNILLVEPNRYMARLLRTVLQSLGVTRIEIAENAEDGVSAFRQGGHDIIITDLFLPGMDGFEFIKAVRTSEGIIKPYTPIIVNTAYTEQRNVVAARDVGMTEFLKKPFSVLDVYRRIHATVMRPRPFILRGDYYIPDRRRHEPNRHNHEGAASGEVERRKSEWVAKAIAEAEKARQEAKQIKDAAGSLPVASHIDLENIEAALCMVCEAEKKALAAKSATDAMIAAAEAAASAAELAMVVNS